MFIKKLKSVAETIGLACFALLAVYGAFSIMTGSPAWAAGRAADVVPAPQQAPQAAASGWGGATVPLVTNYQGIVKDMEGNPLSGYYTVTFCIYSDVTALITQSLWSETHVSVTVRDGRFSVLLGNVYPLTNSIPADLFNDPDRFIGVTVHPYDEMVPRQRFASMPYTFHANHAATATHAVDGVPSGAIIIWTSTDGTCPSGYTRVSSLDGQFLRGGVAYGDTGGAATHNHGGSTGDAGAHSHTISWVGDHTHEKGGINTCGDGRSGCWEDTKASTSAGGHSHSASSVGNHAHSITDASNLPPYTDVVFCQRQ